MLAAANLAMSGEELRDRHAHGLVDGPLDGLLDAEADGAGGDGWGDQGELEEDDALHHDDQVRADVAPERRDLAPLAETDERVGVTVRARHVRPERVRTRTCVVVVDVVGGLVIVVVVVGGPAVVVVVGGGVVGGDP